MAAQRAAVRMSQSLCICVSICLCCHLKLLHHRWGHWGGWAWQRQHICCISKTRWIRKGWAELCHTRTYIKSNQIKWNKMIKGWAYELCHTWKYHQTKRCPPQNLHTAAVYVALRNFSSPDLYSLLKCHLSYFVCHFLSNVK